MAVVLILLGLFCIGYYIRSVAYAGFDISLIWLWLAGGLGMIFFGVLFYWTRGMHWQIPFLLKIIASTCLVCLGVWFVTAEGLIFSGMKQKGRSGLDYILVLGCKVKGKYPSKALTERLETAERYLRENPRTQAVLSGGQGSGEDISEAACMQQFLLKAGISKERLIVEDCSTSTRENLEFCHQLLDGKGGLVGLVTSNFHVYRSVCIAKKVGYEKVWGIAAPSHTVLQLHYLVREFFALTRELLRVNGNMKS